MPTFQHPGLVWMAIALIIAWFAIGSLRVIGYEFFNAVLWHNLRVKVQVLRREQDRRLQSLQQGEQAPPAQPAPAEPAEPAGAVGVEMGEAA